MQDNIAENLKDALEYLSDILRSGTQADKAVARAAEEFDLNPILLKRKFEERHSVSPNRYKPPLSRLAMERRAARTYALHMASQRYDLDLCPGIPPDDMPFLFGKIRTIPPGTIINIDKREWAMIGIDPEPIKIRVCAKLVGETKQEDFGGRFSVSSGIPTSIFDGKSLDEVVQIIKDRIVIPANEEIE